MEAEAGTVGDDGGGIKWPDDNFRIILTPTATLANINTEMQFLAVI